MQAPRQRGVSTAYVGLGANLGDPAATLRCVLAELGRVAGVRVRRVSGLYRSRAVGPGPQPDYVNAVVRLECTLAPQALLDRLQELEALHGRVRDGTRWGPRTLDLDLLLYDELQLNGTSLTLPHPELCNRNFVLVPLLDIDPEIVIPGRGPARAALEKVGRDGLWPL
jgi:2-amino-4-hydroxy-6-hydroxymethyldihydropteridine diphosphokinase